MSVSTGTIIESVKSTFRKIKFLRFGNNDTNNAYQTADFGSDFVAPKGWTVIYAKTMNDAEPVIIGVVNKLPQTLSKGEKSLFSTSEDGESVAFAINLRNDGTVEIGGSDDYAVGFTDLKTQFDELNDKYNKLIQTILAWVPIATDGGTALKTALTSASPLNSLADIDKAKKEKIKLQ